MHNMHNKVPKGVTKSNLDSSTWRGAFEAGYKKYLCNLDDILSLLTLERLVDRFTP